MQLVQAHFVARPQNYGTSRNNVLTICSNVLTLLTTFFAAVEEGSYKAAQYYTLARKSDELAALGLSRDDLRVSLCLEKSECLVEAAIAR